MSHTCPCGAMLPDKRAKYCDACRGSRAKQQDSARKAKQLGALEDIDWNYLGLAVRLKLEQIRANDKRVQQLVYELAAVAASCPAPVIPRAARGGTLRPENLRRVLAWLRRPAEDFTKRPDLEVAARSMQGGTP